MAKGYDEKCEELAEYFLDGVDARVDESEKRDLAQHIQDAIENWFAGRHLKSSRRPA